MLKIIGSIITSNKGILIYKIEMSPRNIRRALDRQVKRTEQAKNKAVEARKNYMEAENKFENARFKQHQEMQNVYNLQKLGESISNEYTPSGSLDVKKQERLIKNHFDIICAIKRRDQVTQEFIKAHRSLQLADQTDTTTDIDSVKTAQRLRQLKHNIDNHYRLKWKKERL